mgnify:CR=1 FL=1
MAEYHKKATLDGSPTYAEIMHALYGAFNSTSAQDYIQFPTEGGNKAVYVDTEPNGSLEFGTPASSASWITGAYFIVEPKTAYPGTGKWQLKVRITGTNEIKLELGTDGGWVSSTHGFASNGTGELLMNPGTDTGAAWLTSPATLSQIYISAGQDTYGSSTYTYVRVVFRHGSSACVTAFYCGGYVPLSSAADTKPVVLLIGKPTGGDDTKGWGRNDANTATNFNRTPPDDAHSGSPANSTCYIRHLADFISGTGRHADRSGNAAAPSSYLFTTAGNCLGTFGTATFRGFDNSIADWTSSTSGGYVVVGDMLHRFTAT